MVLDDFVRDGETKAGALSLGFGREEGFRHALRSIGADADAVVRYDERDALVVRTNSERHEPTFIASVARIEEEIYEHLFEESRIAWGVLVRPGAEVKRGDVLATLDCRNAGATSQAVAMQARALEARQQAIAHESVRVQGLLDGGFVSPNEAEQKSAQSASEQAQLLATQAKLVGASLEVNDCILRAPFNGEVAMRSIDPGAFVRPGASIVSIVDRASVRVVGDAPEVDFDVVEPKRKVTIHMLATGKDVVATISRRAPSADIGTRTVRFELDVSNSDRSIPVGTTGETRIEVGEPVSASEIPPLYAASVRGTKANVFVIEGDVAHTRVVPVRGEISGRLFLDPELTPGSFVVTEGRALLKDGDKVSAAIEKARPASSSAPEAAPPATATDRKAATQ